MAEILRLPKLNMMMKSGTVTQWYKKEGDKVDKGQPLYTLETEKVTTDVEAVESGTLLAILAPEGTALDCLEPVAVIGEPGEPLPPEISKPGAEAVAKPGVEPTQVAATRPEFTVIPLSDMRKRIGERLSRSYNEALHLTISVQADMSQASSLRESLENERNFHPSYTDIIVRAAAETLKNYPMINAVFEDGELRSYASANIAVATALDGGLITPVVPEADKKSLLEVSSAIADLSEKAKVGKLDISEVMGGTFTVTNLGMFGVESFSPIINPPQIAILAVGKVEKRVVVCDGKIEIRPMAYLSLAFDHRIIDGADAARFLSDLKGKLEDLSWLKD
jgi:pyruvate dehydrogenase E2 component (dihydrolipoamide acetyltransferase)